MKQQRPVQRDIAKQEKSKYRKGIVNKNNYKPIIYTAIGIIGAIALAGFIISGGLLPNVNKGTISSSSSSTTPSVQGAIYGHVSGPAGLPAIGAYIYRKAQERYLVK